MPIVRAARVRQGHRNESTLNLAGLPPSRVVGSADTSLASTKVHPADYVLAAELQRQVLSAAGTIYQRRFVVLSTDTLTLGKVGSTHVLHAIDVADIQSVTSHARADAAGKGLFRAFSGVHRSRCVISVLLRLICGRDCQRGGQERLSFKKFGCGPTAVRVGISCATSQAWGIGFWCEVRPEFRKINFM